MLNRLKFRLKDMAVKFLQRRDIHIFRTRFYNPIPDLQDLERRAGFWARERELVGVDLDLDRQLRTLSDVVVPFAGECNFSSHPQGPHDYHIHKDISYGLLSATVLHGFIRTLSPARVIEIGSGDSTLVSARAAALNTAAGKPTALTVIDPYPAALLAGMPGLANVIPSKVEELPVEFFDQLEAGDILFIDSSHVVTTGNDVAYLYLEVLPRLKPGVLVHVHDVFFPFDYPSNWILENRWYWNEQYLLQAFLTHNDRFQVLFSESYLKAKAAATVEASLPGVSRPEANAQSNCLWMKRIR